MSYGDPRWQEWVLGEEEGIKQIKFAYVLCLPGCATSSSVGLTRGDIVMNMALLPLTPPT